MQKGILLVNLGSPDSTSVKDLKRYLDEFLMDERVIDKNVVFRNLLVRGIILNTRPKKSAAAYKSIWWPEGSPLIVISYKILEKIRKRTSLPVALGMRYGNPSIHAGIKELVDNGVTHISLMPLYPQYAMSTTETVVVKAKQVVKKYFKDVKLNFVPPFYDNPEYLNILSKVIKAHLPESFDKLLLSYHGVPERHILEYDKTGHCNLDDCCHKKNQPQHHFCYRHQCYKTTELLMQELNIPEEKYIQTFQSRLGRDPWIKPFTDETLHNLPGQGVLNIAVVSPAFVSDCLETLEEIAIEGKNTFLGSGGQKFHYIPCLNDNDEWISLILKMCMLAFDNEYEIPQLRK